MSPDRLGPLAYHATGGSVVSRSGRDVTAAVATLLAFYQEEAVEQRLRGDEAGSKLCSKMGRQLADAIASADDWRPAAGVPAPSPHTRS